MPGLIDIHAHDYPEMYLEACKRPDSGFTHYFRTDGRLIVQQDGGVALAAPQPLPSLEQRIAAMDKAGVDIQVLSVSAPNVFRFPDSLRVPLTRDINDSSVDLASRSGGRLRIFASLPLPNVAEALRELERVLALPHVVGVALCTNIDGLPLDDPRFTELLEELSLRQVTVFVHATVPGCTDGMGDYAMALAMGFMTDPLIAIGRLVYSGTIDRYPGIKWVFSHLGGAVPFVLPRYDNYFAQFPECNENIGRPPSEILRDVYFDIVTMHPPALRCALDTLAIEQLVFGSDYPHVPGGIDRFTQVMKSAGLTPSELQLVGTRNAQKLIGVASPTDTPL